MLFELGPEINEFEENERDDTIRNDFISTNPPFLIEMNEKSTISTPLSTLIPHEESKREDEEQ